jgi:hypothetical protein
MSSGGGTECPECEIIILSYAQLPSIASQVQWKCESIEALYGTEFVQRKIHNNPALHQRIVAKFHALIDRQTQDVADLDAIIAELAS